MSAGSSGSYEGYAAEIHCPGCVCVTDALGPTHRQMEQLTEEYSALPPFTVTQHTFTLEGVSMRPALWTRHMGQNKEILYFVMYHFLVMNSKLGCEYDFDHKQIQGKNNKRNKEKQSPSLNMHRCHIWPQHKTINKQTNNRKNREKKKY